MLTVLVADDEKIARRRLVRLIEETGDAEVVAACAGGRDAIDQTVALQPQLLFLDVQMPDMDGLEATTLIRTAESSQGKRTPIIAVTAHSMKGDRERCMAAGMDNYVTKPFDAARLIQVVETTAGLGGAATTVPAAN